LGLIRRKSFVGGMLIICLSFLLVLSGCGLKGNQSGNRGKTNHQAAESAADYTAVVNISSTSPKEIPLGMSGNHSELTVRAYRYDNPELIDRVNQYDRMGYVKITGTNTNVYDWKTASFGEEALGQLQADATLYNQYMNNSRMVEAKGGEALADLRVFLQKTGAKAIIPVNVFTNTVDQIGDLARYSYQNHIPVLYFELGNEVSFYTATSNLPWTQRFKNSTDYLNRMEAFNKAIKENYPGAKTVVAMDNISRESYDKNFKSFPDHFWDAITFHRFVGDGPDLPTAISRANWGLDTWNNYLAHYLADSDPDARIEIGEHSVALGGRLDMTHYNGLVVAENMLRLSKFPNVDYFQSWRIPMGIGQPTNNYPNMMDDAYQRNETVDTNNLTFGLFDAAPTVSARVVDGALNNSNAAWVTTVTGGASVETLLNFNPGTKGTMPALYAQAYRGVNGKDYVVITNKSDKTHDVTINMDNESVNQAMTMTYVTADPASKNTAASKPVYLQTATVKAGDPVVIPNYSVTRLEWTRTATPDIPPAPWLVSADPSNNQLDMKWEGGNNGNGVDPNQLTNTRNNKVELKWQVSPGATGYKIAYGTDPNHLTKVEDAGNATSYTVPALQSDSTYYFAVAAYNKSGMSAYSNANPSDVVAVKIAAPAAPAMTWSHYEQSGHAVIEWRSVPGAVGYKLKYGTSSGNYTNVVDVGNNVGKIVEGLTNGVPYYFAVSAYNGTGQSPDSSEVSVTPSADVPLAPHNLAITGETDTSISLNWLKTLTPREYEYFENGNANWSQVSGTWTVVDNPNPTRETKVFQSPETAGPAITVFENATSGDLKGEAAITVKGSYGDDSEVGIVTNYTDSNNYYKFVYDSKTSRFQLIRQRSDGSVILAQAPRTTGQDPTNMVLSLEVNGSQLIPRVNGTALVKDPIIDSDPLAEGIFGLTTTSQVAYFDDVRLYKELGTVNVYRSSQPDANFSLVASGITKNTWSDSNLDPSKSYYYRVTAVYKGNESYDHSNTVLR
jgi:hypothetical protein